MKHIPNFLTSLNLVCGFIAIIVAGKGDLATASWLITVAMIFDFSDGFTARALNAYSPVGKELDSLADVISFGVAPAIIIYQLLGNATGTDDVFSGNFAFILIPALMPALAALRLAIFNLDTTQTTTFRGLPTPANALAVISLVIGASYSGSEFISGLTGSVPFLIILTLALSLIMVSRIPLLSLKVKNLAFRGNEGLYILVAVMVLSIAVFGIAALPLIVPVYIAASLLQLVIK